MSSNSEAILKVEPGFPLQGSLPESGPAALPGDKSISHRALILAALAQGQSWIENLLVAGVTQVLLNSLDRLGVPLSWQDGSLLVQGLGLEPSGVRPASPDLDCGNSATSLRLLAGLLSAWGAGAVLDGSPALRKRPMQRIIEPLEQMGVRIASDSGCAPLIIYPSPRPLRSLDYRLPTASAQVKSCLTIAALAAGGASTLLEPGPSRDHTERMLLRQGVRFEQAKAELDGSTFYQLRIHPAPPHGLLPIYMAIPGDFSAAAFLIVAAVITPGSEISLHGVGLNPTRTGLLEALAAMGADIRIASQADSYGEPTGSIIVRHSSLRGATVAGDLVVRMIDEFPAFAVAAACAQGVTTVRQAIELRYKESDRIGKLVKELARLGVAIQETADGFLVEGGHKIHGAEVYSHGDHRLAMALAVAGLAADSAVRIASAQVVGESFPGFSAAMRSLGARVELTAQGASVGGRPG